MAEKWKPATRETLMSWVDAIVDEASDELNDWEIRFVEDMRTKLLSGWNLTEAQQNKLEQIYAEKTK